MPADDLAARLDPLTSDPAQAGILCDVDGTLAPIVEHPGDAEVSPAVARLLAELASRYACVACVSGRTALDARRVVGVTSIGYVGLHGAEILEPGAERPRLAPAVEAWRGPVEEFSTSQDDASLRALGVRPEDKGPIVAFHWRGVPDDDAARARLAGVAARAAAAGLATHWGRKVLEIRPPVGIGKGAALHAVVGANDLRAVLYGGDDATDLDAFDALDELVASGRVETAVRVGVRSDEGPREIVARADVVVDGVAGFVRILEALSGPG